MPDPKHFMDDKHTFVRGYVRRKHKEEEPDDNKSPLDSFINFIGFLLFALPVWAIFTIFFHFAIHIYSSWTSGIAYVIAWVIIGICVAGLLFWGYTAIKK